MAEETKKEPAGSCGGTEKSYKLPKIDFSTFVLSLNSSVLVQLGLIEDPGGAGKIKNLPMAKQTIDMLVMLEEKTRGNLTSDEEKILKNVLYELRMLYVKEKG
jgi:Domain of unknown function (DUF1844)